jgi:hypothetical protein
VASSETQDVLHWAMHPTLCRHIWTAIGIGSDLPAFFVAVDVVVGHNHS